MSAPSTTTDAAVLPSGYRLHSAIDLKDDRRAASAVQVTFLGLAVALIALAILLDLPMASDWPTGVVVVVTLAACVVFMALHELTHGVALWVLSGVRPSYALRFPYLVTGSPAFLSKRIAVVVALAPAIIWTAVLVVAMLIVPSALLLTAYVVMTLSIAGSAGDYVEAWAISQLPSTALVRDDGKQTAVYLPAS